jgi:hypothetical protein
MWLCLSLLSVVRHVGDFSHMTRMVGYFFLDIGIPSLISP